jgi:coproporphyrinogen III oxidase-like Fe-S oxidoreductase
MRTKNWASTALYCAAIEKGSRALESCETLPPLQRAGEIAAFGLRMNTGWPLVEFREVTGVDLCQEWAGEIEQLIGRNWAQLDSRSLHLTDTGLRFADAAAEMFLK